jgi:hypothetical protein
MILLIEKLDLESWSIYAKPVLNPPPFSHVDAKPAFLS